MSISEFRKIPCVIQRGGTSEGSYLRDKDLPKDPVLRDNVILSIFGSSDIRQIDGLGRGPLDEQGRHHCPVDKARLRGIVGEQTVYAGVPSTGGGRPDRCPATAAPGTLAGRTLPVAGTSEVRRLVDEAREIDDHGAGGGRPPDRGR